MLNITSQEWYALINSFIWPLTRLLGVIAIAPPFGNNAVPVTIKLGFGVLLTMLVAPTLPANSTDPVSLGGMLILAGQFLIGISIGFVMRLAFSAIEMAGEVTGLTMGLGFATFFDPFSQGRTSAIAQYLVLIATLLMLSLNVHLSLIETLVLSFQSMPADVDVLRHFDFKHLTGLGGQIFAIGMQLSLPIIAALLLTNVALGILTRAAPQLNLFGIGFPITITVGFLMLGLITPYLMQPWTNLFQHSIEAIQFLLAPRGK